jgi:uncharacterized protein YbjT (DUF2867 family)
MFVITGAAGNTGTVVAERLLARGQRIRVIGRSAERLERFVAKGAEPIIASLDDVAAMTRAFTGAQAAYLVIPPNLQSANYRADQDRISESYATAAEKAALEYAVTLSSVGADKPDKTGPVVGLHLLEQKLNRIGPLSVLHVRAGYFLENLLAQIGVIRAFGIVGSPARVDLPLPMIATGDIGAAAAEALLNREFSGKQTRELLGQRDVTYAEATAVIGKAIGKPGLPCVRLPQEQLKAGLIQAGMSPNMAELILEMAEALDSGHMAALEPRAALNTTPTSIETFMAEEFVPRFQGKTAGA